MAVDSPFVCSKQQLLASMPYSMDLFEFPSYFMLQTNATTLTCLCQYQPKRVFKATESLNILVL